MPKYDALLIDGKNSVYRAVFAGHSDERFQKSGHDYLVIVCRFLRSYLEKFKPSSVHIFWDAPKETLWRKLYLVEYKDGRNKKDHGFDVESTIDDCIQKCVILFKHMGFYQYVRDKVEADDLVYAWCRVRRRPDKLLVVSNDRDYQQIPYQFDSVDVYDPLKGIIVEVPELDPVETKCFIGDKSDNISGYYGIGPVKSKKLVSDFSHRKEFFKERGRNLFDRNRKIIDMSLCPYLADNMSYIADVLARDVSFNEDAVKDYVKKIAGLMMEYKNCILPFRSIGKDK